jgi:hypothetical protein
VYPDVYVAVSVAYLDKVIGVTATVIWADTVAGCNRAMRIASGRDAVIGDTMVS